MLSIKCSDVTNLIVVYVEVVGGTEDCYERWEPRRLGFTIHTISSILCFVRPDDT